jgi:hypothetical protein
MTMRKDSTSNSVLRKRAREQVFAGNQGRTNRELCEQIRAESFAISQSEIMILRIAVLLKVYSPHMTCSSALAMVEIILLLQVNYRGKKRLRG